MLYQMLNLSTKNKTELVKKQNTIRFMRFVTIILPVLSLLISTLVCFGCRLYLVAELEAFRGYAE